MKNKNVFNIIAIICIAIFCAALTPVELQNDTYYTIKIGEHILENGIDMKDPFSWHENLSYTYPHWLYDVATYLVYQVGGYNGIYIATIILAVALGLIIYLTNLKLTKNNIISFLITIGALYLIKDFIAARAQLVTFILFILTVYGIEMFLETKKKRYIALLIIIPILIANLHVAVWPFYFVLYLPYIAEYLLCIIMDTIVIERLKIFINNKKIYKLSKKEGQEEKIDKLQAQIEKDKQTILRIQENQLRRRQNPYKIVMNRTKATKWLIVILLITILTGFLTPLGTTPYTYLIKTLQGNTTQSISEHLPLTLINNKEFMCLIILFLSILLFTDVKIRLRDLFMLSGLLLLAFMTRRQTSMYIIIGAYVLNRLVCTFLDKYAKEDCEKVLKSITTRYGCVMIVGIMLILSGYLYKPKISDNYVKEQSYPTKAIEYIKESIDISTMKLYNEYNYGSYLLLNDIPVFIDSRADLYAPEFNEGTSVFSDFINISNLNKHYEKQFEEYKITHVMLYTNSKLNIFISKDNKYKEIYKDDNFVIYERTQTEKVEEFTEE